MSEVVINAGRSHYSAVASLSPYPSTVGYEVRLHLTDPLNVDFRARPHPFYHDNNFAPPRPPQSKQHKQQITVEWLLNGLWKTMVQLQSQRSNAADSQLDLIIFQMAHTEGKASILYLLYQTIARLIHSF